MLALPLPSGSGCQDSVRDAQRLRDAGRLTEALKLLDESLLRQPDDVEAQRLRAQTLYWLKDFAAARAGYAAALQGHPEHAALRVEYARMLAETGDRRGARALLEQAVRSEPVSADAEALLGTILYWDGDLTGARRLFLQALRRNPGQQDAARQLREIQVMSSGWLRLAPAKWHDDQPLDRTGIAVEAGGFVTPLLSVAVRSETARYPGGTARTFWTNALDLSHYAPAARLETRLSVGAFRRPGDPGGLDWTGRAVLGIRADGGVTLLGRVERAPYLSTLSSLATPLVTSTVAGAMRWTHGRGWLGEAAVERQRFPDSNEIRSAYAWLLAPLARGAGGQIQAGYAVSAADALEDRFALARPLQPLPSGDPRFDLGGAYRPYYTPARLVSHSVIAAVTAGKAGGPLLRAGGSYGVAAREDATSFQVAAGQVVSVIGRRGFTPWTIRGALEVPATPSLALSVGGESGRTSYYHWTTGTVQLVYRFVPKDPRVARRH